MNVEIIVIGDELLIGQVTDTNSGWIARELNHIGWEVTEITTVRDRSREITDALNSSFGRVDVVLMTGGLGPTILQSRLFAIISVESWSLMNRYLPMWKPFFVVVN